MRRIGAMTAAVALLAAAPLGGVANAKPSHGVPFTQYAYEQDGTDVFEPTCSPSWTQCNVYEFEDQWALSTDAPVTDADGNPVEPDGVTPDGSLLDHGFDFFRAHTTNGTFDVTLEGTTTTWSGSYTGTFRGPRAATGSFSLAGTDGSLLAGSIAFLGDGVAKLTGTISH